VPRKPQPPSEPSQRSLDAFGSFARLLNALNEGRLAKASREQAELRRLGFHVDVRPFDPPHGSEGGNE
jgi:hypothetical protein